MDLADDTIDPCRMTEFYVANIQYGDTYENKRKPGLHRDAARFVVGDHRFVHRALFCYPAIRATSATQIGTLRLSVPCGDNASTRVPTAAPARLATAMVSGVLSSA